MIENAQKNAQEGEVFDIEKAIQEVLTIKEIAPIKLYIWAKKLGIPDGNTEELTARAVEFLATLPDEEQAEQLRKRIAFPETATIKARAFTRRKELKELSALAPTESLPVNPLFEKLGITAAVGTGIAAVEVTRRFDELMNGSKQTYRANISTGELAQQLELKLKNQNMEVQSNGRGAGGGGEEILILGDSGQELLKIIIANSNEPAPLNKTAYDAVSPRKMPKVEVTISGSNMDNLLTKGMGLAGEAMSVYQNLSTNDGERAASGIMSGLQSLNGLLGTFNLPEVVSKAIEEQALREEREFDAESQRIADQNNKRMEIVVSALMCTSCGQARTGAETNGCSSCGAQLSPRDEKEVPQLNKDLKMFKQMGFLPA